MNLTREQRLIAGGVAGLVLLALILGIVTSDEPDQPPPVADAPTTTQVARPVAPALAGVDPSLISCDDLLTIEEIDEALGLLDLPFEERRWGEIRRQEACTYPLTEGEGVFVRIEPGSPADLEPGARLLGVTGDPVIGVGNDARWFGGAGAEGDGTVGALSVYQTTSLGALHFRVVLGRPDITSPEQLEVAKKTALAALPRFPGVEPPERDPVVVTFEREPVDRSGVSFVDNLLAKEEAGEWTRGEGLVATLRLFAGEAEASAVLRHPELVDLSGAGVIQMAREYLSEGPDAEAKAEITRLLEHLFPSRERLEQMAGLGETTAAVLGLQTISLITATGENDCQVYWGADDPCMEKLESGKLQEVWPGKYNLWVPKESAQETAGWTQDDVFEAVKAMEDSAITYEAMGEMPQVDLLFTPYSGSHTNVDSLLDIGVCFININTPMQSLPDEHFRQQIAQAMAYCMIAATFGEHMNTGYQAVRWWVDGLATWLSTVVYVDANGEWVLSDELAATELETTLLDRTFTNWVFFEHSDDFIGWEGNFDLVRTVPPTSYDAMEPLLHTYVQGLTDANIPDSGGGTVPYKPPADTVAIGCPSIPIVVLEEAQPLGVVRLHVAVDPGTTAFVEYEVNKARASWREGAPGSAGSWSDELPTTLEGESVFVVTTLEEGGTFDLEVTEVEPECEEDEGGPDDPSDAECPLDCPPSSYYYQED